MFENISDNTRSHLTETHLQALLDFAVSQSPSMFYIGSLTGDRSPRFVSANVEAITGHRPAAFLDNPGFGVRQIHPEDRLTYDRAVADLGVKGVRTQEYRFATAAGDYLWIRDEMRLLPSADGSDEMVGCMSDITEEKNARSQLARSDAECRRIAQLFEDAVHSLPNGFSIYDAEGKLTLANRSLASMIGGETDPDALVGLSRSDIIERILPLLRSFDGHRVSDTPEWNRKATDRLNNLSNDSVELEYEGENWRLVSSHPTSEGGQVVIGTDITHLKKAESTIRESEEQFRSIIRANPSPVRVSVFGSWEVLYESPAASALFFSSVMSDMQPIIQSADGSDEMVGCMSDITEEKNARSQLARSDAEYRRIAQLFEDAVHSLPNGFSIYDAEGKLTLANRSLASMIGGETDPDALVGLSRSDIIERILPLLRSFDGHRVSDTPEWNRKATDRLNNLSNDSVELEYEGENWRLVSSHPTSEGGQVVIGTDITHLKKAESTIRESEEQFRSIIRANPSPVRVSVFGSWEVLYESPAASALFGEPRPFEKGARLLEATRIRKPATMSFKPFELVDASTTAKFR